MNAASLRLTPPTRFDSDDRIDLIMSICRGARVAELQAYLSHYHD